MSKQNVTVSINPPDKMWVEAGKELEPQVYAARFYADTARALARHLSFRVSVSNGGTVIDEAVLMVNGDGKLMLSRPKEVIPEILSGATSER